MTLSIAAGRQADSANLSEVEWRNGNTTAWAETAAAALSTTLTLKSKGFILTGSREITCGLFEVRLEQLLRAKKTISLFFRGTSKDVSELQELFRHEKFAPLQEPSRLPAQRTSPKPLSERRSMFATPEQREWFELHRTAQYGLCYWGNHRLALRITRLECGRCAKEEIFCPVCEAS